MYETVTCNANNIVMDLKRSFKIGNRLFLILYLIVGLFQLVRNLIQASETGESFILWFIITMLLFYSIATFIFSHLYTFLYLTIQKFIINQNTSRTQSIVPYSIINNNCLINLFGNSLFLTKYSVDSI